MLKGMEFHSCLENQNQLKRLFAPHSSSEEKYAKIIELGRTLAPYPKEYQTPDHLVKGCQSLLYLWSFCENEKMHFVAASDALISAGLASLLLMIYNGESPTAILKCPPAVLKELQITDYLSPSRANGLRSLYLRMQQEALQAIASKSI